MTIHQLFNAIDSTNDKYLKEVLSDEQDGAAAKRRFPIKPLAVCAACLAVIIAGTALIPRLDNRRLLDPFDRLSHSGIVKTMTDPEPSRFSSADSEISFGEFSTTESSNQEKLSVTHKTMVSTDVFVSIDLFCSGDLYKGYYGESIPARLQLLADGEPTEFSLDGVNALYHDVDVAVVEDDIRYYAVEFNSSYHIMFTADASLKQLSAVVTFYPETVFDYRQNTFNAQLTKAVIARNTAVKSGIARPADDYERCDYSSINIDLECADTYKYLASAVSDAGIYDLNMNIIREKTGGNEFVTYREGEDLIMKAPAFFDYEYRLYILIDGQFIPWSDGKYSEPVYETRSLQEFTIPGELIPDGDQHTFQVLVEPILSNNIDVSQAASMHPKTLIKGEPDLSVEFRCNEANKAFISIKTEKTKYEKGEPIKLTATVKNVYTAPITLSCSYPSIALSVNLCKDGDELINREGYFDDSNLKPAELILGTDEEYTLEMTFDQTVLTANGTQKPAERGVYEGICTVTTNSSYGTNARAYTIPIKVELI